VKKFPFLHIVLFLLTFLSMLVAGALFQKGADIFHQPGKIAEGLPFALTLMVILLSHEFSHYFTSRKHHTEATLPYFIPAPSVIGTFGAFIKMKSPIVTRKALVDIGASGPIAGFILSVIAAVVGLHYSSVVPVVETAGGLRLGDSILFSLLTRMMIGIPPDSYDILLHPVAFAGWIGLFVTSLNLIPIGQLDGGHIAYAFLRERHRTLSIVLVVTLFVLGLFFWNIWAVWGALMVVLGLRHPPVIYWEVPLDRKRRVVGVLALVIFVITFMPSPFTILD
jgi:membrane-associated protease RseP (regulator of RpoE activity)